MSKVAYIDHDELTALIKSDAVAGKDYQVVDVRGECKKVIDYPQLANRYFFASQTKTFEEETCRSSSITFSI